MRVLFGILGFLIGGTAGAFAGFGIGEAISTLANISCFEGECGYFVVAVALIGVIIGALLGLVLGLWLASRRLRLTKPREPGPKPGR